MTTKGKSIPIITTPYYESKWLTLLLLYFKPKMDSKFHILFLGLLSLAAASAVPSLERIVNGKSIDIEQAPWQIALLLNSARHCGGSILSDRFILTAAHCLKGLLSANLTVRAGSRYAEHGGQLLQVEHFKIHKYFNDQEISHDIGVMLPAEPLEFGQQVQPISLAQESPKHGESVFVSGWGVLTNSKIPVYSKDLQGIYVDIVDHQTCLSLYSPIKVTEDVICAGNSDKGFCNMDSGGPLVLNRVQVGIVSWSMLCWSILSRSLSECFLFL